MTIEILETEDGINHDWTIYQEGTTTAEDLSSFTAATMKLVSADEKTTYNSSITLSFQDKPNGVIRYTSDSGTDSLPSVPARKEDLQIKGQVTLTGAGIEDATYIFPIKILKKL